MSASSSDIVLERNPEVANSIVAAGIRTNYHDAGRGDPVLLIHGSGPGVSAWANWRLVIPALAERARVIAPDMAGFGFTERRADLRYDMDTWVAQALGLMDALGIEQADVVGNSFGGALALALAIRHPRRVRRLVLMATTPSVGAPGIGWAALLDDDMLASGLKLPTATPLGLTYQTMAMAGWTSAAMLPHLKNTPVLILMGERDGVVPAGHWQAIADLIDGAVLEVVPGSHLFPFTHAAQVAERISAFLDPMPMERSGAGQAAA